MAIFIVVAVAGLLSYTYPGTGPTEVERLVTQVIEDSVASISNLDVMTSTSSEGASTIATFSEFTTTFRAGVRDAGARNRVLSICPYLVRRTE